MLASKDLLGGICESRKTPLRHRTNANTSIELSGNTILISAIGMGGVQLKLTDLALVLIHEIGHSLGTLKHDMDLSVERLECSGYLLDDNYSGPVKKFSTDEKGDFSEPPLGHYVMWGKDPQGRELLKGNNLRFSPCSIEYINNILRNPEKNKCLRTANEPFCGNGKTSVRLLNSSALFVFVTRR